VAQPRDAARGAAGRGGRLTPEAPITATGLAERLGAWLERMAGGTVAVTRVERLPGGASRESWVVEFSRADGSSDRVVVRRDPPGHHVHSSRRGEFLLLRTVAAAGIPVPRVRWCEDDPAVLGAPFFVMDFVDGETLPRRLLRDDAYAVARAALPAQLAAALARLHAVDPAAPPIAALPGPPPGTAPALAELARHEQVFRAVAPDPHPVLELAFRWLAAAPPAPRAATLVHGDYRIGNVMFGPEGLRAVLDWELAHRGDPMEDIGWLCVRSWRFGADDRPVGGLGEREPFFAAYERAGGEPVDPARVRWWEVFGNLKWAVVCLVQTRTFLDGGVRNVELASLGRRVAEMELELLELTEG
jgi:aminoglycoside phosphotransferase (APT) family kinase protein